MKILQFEIKKDFLEVVCLFKEDDGWNQIVQQVKSELAKNLKVKGFREGKVPVELLNQHVKNSTILEKAGQLAQENAAKTLLQERKSTLVNKYRLFATKIEKISFSECQIYLKWQKLPTVKVMKWKGFECSLKPIDVTQEEIDNKINELKNYFATFVEINQEVTKDGFALINYQGKIADEVIESLSNKEDNYQVGQKRFGPEFDQGLIGMKKDDEKTLTVELQKDYLDPKLAGKKVVFKLKVIKVQEKKLPQDNELVSLLKMDKIKNFNDLSVLIVESIKKSKVGQMHREVIALVWPKLLEQSVFEIPTNYLEDEAKMMKNRYLEDLKQKNKTMSQLLSERKITETQFDQEIKDKVKSTLSDYLLVNEIADLAKIEVTEKEIEDYYQFLSKNQNKKLDEVKKIYSKPLLYNNLLRFRVEDFLVQDTLRFNGLIKDSSAPGSN